AYYALLSRWAEARLDFEYSAAEAAVYAGWSPVAWALALGWLIFACFTGYGGYLNTFLSIKPLVIFSRISYAVYLTQFAVFFYNVGVTRTSEQFTILKGIDPVEFIVVIALSVVMTLIFDFPMQEIKNILLTSDTRSKKSVEQRKNDFKKTL
ncbi:Nrf-6_4 protein, partial [Gryllus bimaculatus]